MNTRVFLFVFFFTQILSAQTNGIVNLKTKVFLDCSSAYCDQDYIRSEIKMVDFVRDRFLCDLHVILNANYTGSGGEQMSLIFIGKNAYSGKNDTLGFFNDPTATNDEIRKKMLLNLNFGLLRYVVNTNVAKDISIQYKDNSSSKDSSQTTKDPWNYWQFALDGSSSFSGNQNSKSQYFNFSCEGNRETESSRVQFYMDNNTSRQTYKVDTESIVVNRDNQNFYFSYTMKHSQHWATGISLNSYRNVVNNIKFRVLSSPAVEYSILPYKNFNNERVIIAYNIGPQLSLYNDSTIYERKRDFLFFHSLGSYCSFTKPWGSIYASAKWSNYLNDFKINNLEIFGRVDWRIYKGLSIYLYGSYEFIRDQISLPKAGASRDDILTQRRLIQSSFEYYLYFGLKYRFGSIYNSQVFPAFKN